MTELRTRRLVLHPLREEDLPFLLGHWNRPEVRKYLFDDQPTSEERARGLLSHSWEDERVRGYCLCRIDRRSDGATIGTAGIRFAPLLDGPELVYSLEPEEWGNGYATEAAKRLVRWAKDAGAPFILGGVDPANHASNQVLQKAGLRPLRILLGVQYLGRKFRRAAK